MSNVIALNVPLRRMSLGQSLQALLQGFATQRHAPQEVMWLKENAELLNILECTGCDVPHGALSVHEEFYENIEENLTFFPQYYRFILSIGLDLEDLGIGGAVMERLCHRVAQTGLVEAELSDLQRAEARRLLARRGIAEASNAPDLDARLRGFIERPETFAIPNKKAAYELTHIVFYLSEYGRCDPKLSAGALHSLHYAALLAFLDQDIDLLSEICIALRQAGQKPSPIWEQAVRRAFQTYRIVQDDHSPLADTYHEYLVSAWAVAMIGRGDTGCAVPKGRVVFARGASQESALRTISAMLYDLSSHRLGSWTQMRALVMAGLQEAGVQVLEAAEASSGVFEAFFEGFARAPKLSA